VEAAAISSRAGGNGPAERGGNRRGHAVELRHVVPEVRVGVLAVDAEHIGHRYDVAALARRCVLELRHEGVVAESVLQHNFRVGDR
jgi:hypothetical protein